MMTTWTPDEQLCFDIAFALKRVKVPGFRKALTEQDRFSIAKVIVEHLKLMPLGVPPTTRRHAGRGPARAAAHELSARSRRGILPPGVDNAKSESWSW
jgi:hypothetical protein